MASSNSNCFRSLARGIVSLLALALVATSMAGCAGGSWFERGRADARAADDDAVHRIVASGVLRVGMSTEQPPLNMKDREGQPIGLDVDLATALADSMGLELALIERPFAELLVGLRAGDFDLVISNMTITPTRNAEVAFAGPYLISGATLLTRKELVSDFESDEAIDSRERTFGVRSGSTSEAILTQAFPEARAVAVDDLASLVPKVVAGELDGIFADMPWVRFVLARNPDAGLAEVATPFTTEPIGIALDPDSPLLANLVQNYLNALEYTGMLMRLKAYWLNDGEWTSRVAE